MLMQVKRGTWEDPLRGLPPLVLTALVPVLFIALKLASVITWSWGWVLAPIWVPVLIAAVIGALGAALFTLVKWILMARAWLRFRQTMLPELALADPAILTRIEAERPANLTPENAAATPGELGEPGNQLAPREGCPLG